MRDLCRARADMVIDQTRARHRLGKFLLRHGRVWRGGDNWTLKHQAWIAAQRFDDPALRATFAHYRATLDRPGSRGHRDRSRPGGLVHPGPVRRAGGPAGRLPRRDPPGRADPGQRGVRLAPLRHRRRVHGVLRAGPQRVLQRGADPPRAHHPRRQPAPANPAGRVRLGLQVPPRGRRRDRPPPRRPATGGHRPRLDRPSCACAAASAAWTPARPAATSWSPRSPANSPGSSGPR